MGLTEGGIYTQKQGILNWGVFKILKLDEEIAHLRLFKNRFWRRPDSSVVPRLDWSVGHVPISRANVESWRVHLLATENVSDEELEGYRYWSEDPDAGAFP